MLPTDGVIVRDPDILGGTAVFRGTRVPFKNLLDYFHWAVEQIADSVFPELSRKFRNIGKVDRAVGPLGELFQATPAKNKKTLPRVPST